MATSIRPCHIRYSKCYKESYPNNLVDKLFGMDYSKSSPVTEDQLAAIEYIITTALNEQEQDVIRLRYKERKTLSQCAAERNCTHERIRQVENKAVWKMQMPLHATAIKMGLKAFYEQDIQVIYRDRQNLLTCDIRNYTNHRFGLTDRNLLDLYESGITTVGDMLLCNMHDFQEILSQAAATSAIRMRAFCHNDLVKYNDMIVSLEQYMGQHKTPANIYPANLFSIIFGYNLTNHDCTAPSYDQIDGLNMLIEQKLTRFQQSLLYYRYQMQMSIQECSRILHTKKNDIQLALRNIIHILREQPDCYVYIYGMKNHRFDQTIPQVDGVSDNMLIQTQEYLSKLNIAPHDQMAYLKSIKLNMLNLSPNDLTVLQTAGATTAFDVLTSNTSAISKQLQNHIRIAVCLRATTIDCMPISVRANNALRRTGIKSMETIAAMSDDELLAIENLGIGTLKNIRTAIAKILESLQ